MVDYKRIGLDTNVLIYDIEEHPVLMEKVEFFINKIERGKAIGITSFVTLLELLVKGSCGQNTACELLRQFNWHR